MIRPPSPSPFKTKPPILPMVARTRSPRTRPSAPSRPPIRGEPIREHYERFLLRTFAHSTLHQWNADGRLQGFHTIERATAGSDSHHLHHVEMKPPILPMVARTRSPRTQPSAPSRPPIPEGCNLMEQRAARSLQGFPSAPRLLHQRNTTVVYSMASITIDE